MTRQDRLIRSARIFRWVRFPQLARDHGIQVIFIEMPISKKHRDFYHTLPIWPKMRDHVHALIVKSGGKYIEASEWVTAEDHFAD